MTWDEIEKAQKQREEKYKVLIDVEEQKGEFFVICKEHKKIVSPWNSFATSSFYKEVDKGLENCHGGKHQ